SERFRKDFGKEIAITFDIILNHPEFSSQQIANEIGKTPRTVENYLAKLKDAGIIVRKGPKLRGHWEIIEKS
ncbi:MAG: HTH domain-containing protein, partial [Bacteroidota bacterium]|nr:HTH domain-containing protein [Bacteroidota bacterium]